MLRMNKKMSDLINDMSCKTKSLPADLSNHISMGFCKRNGCQLLSALSNKQVNVDLNNFPDKTGYECFFNSVHIDDYVESNYLDNAFLFIDELFKAWRQHDKNELLNAIVSKDEFGLVVKFHLERIGESWVSDNLEKYEDAILIVDSTVDLLSIISSPGVTQISPTKVEIIRPEQM